MTMEKSATEKLVDEISEELNRLFRAARGGRTPEQKPRDMAGSFIVRIGQVVLSGEDPELDRALGVVGRWMVSRASPKKLGLQSWSVDMSKDKGATTFIALLPQTAPSEEEE